MMPITSIVQTIKDDLDQMERPISTPAQQGDVSPSEGGTRPQEQQPPSPQPITPVANEVSLVPEGPQAQKSKDLGRLG